MKPPHWNAARTPRISLPSYSAGETSRITNYEQENEPGCEKLSDGFYDTLSQADEHLAQLKQEARERTLKNLAEARDWTEYRVDPLSGYPYYKLPAGRLRANIIWDRDNDILIIEAVSHRRNVYNRHLPPSHRPLAGTRWTETDSLREGHSSVCCSRVATSSASISASSSSPNSTISG